MKKYFKKISLLTGAVFAVAGLGFMVSQNSELKAQSNIRWCQWFDAPGQPHDACVIAVFDIPCICEEGC